MASRIGDFQKASIAGGVPPPALLIGAKPRTPYINKEECDEKKKQNDLGQMHR